MLNVVTIGAPANVRKNETGTSVTKNELLTNVKRRVRCVVSISNIIIRWNLYYCVFLNIRLINLRV